NHGFEIFVLTTSQCLLKRLIRRLVNDTNVVLQQALGIGGALVGITQLISVGAVWRNGCVFVSDCRGEANVIRLTHSGIRGPRTTRLVVLGECGRDAAENTGCDCRCTYSSDETTSAGQGNLARTLHVFSLFCSQQRRVLQGQPFHSCASNIL